MIEETKELLKETKEDLKDLAKKIHQSFIRSASFPGHRGLEPSNHTLQASLINFLVYDGFNSRHMIFDNKTTYSFILRISPFSGIDRKAVNILTQMVSYEIPENAFIQVVNFASPDISQIVGDWEWECKKEGIYSYLTKKRRDFYLNAQGAGLFNKSGDFTLRNFELYLSISFIKHQGKEANKELIQQMLEVRDKLVKALANANCFAEVMNKMRFDELLEQILIPKDEESTCQCVMHPNYFELQTNKKSRKYIIFEIDQWPGEWSITSGINYVGSFDTGRGLGFPFYISYGFKIEDRMESERKATKMRMLRINQTTSKLAAFFPSMLEETNDWQYVSNEIEKGARLARAVMHIVAIIDGSQDERVAEGAIKDHFYQLGFKINQIKYDVLNNLLASLPMSMAEYFGVFSRQKATSTMLTSNCTSLLPIFADNQNYNSPLMMFAGRRGQVFFFDNYASIENGNFNMVVVGKSGSGKSVFLQEYTTSILRADGQVIVVDDGRSFQNSCQILGGDFIDFSKKKLCINPFSLYQVPAIKSNNFKVDFEEPLIDLIVSILCIITNVDKNNVKDFDTGFYRGLIKKAVQIALERRGGKAGIKDVSNALLHNQELRNRQTKDIADKLAFSLLEYTYAGRYYSYYNGQATLSIQNMLTVFELSSLESNEVLQTSVLLMVVFLVYIKMQGREKRTSLIIDEAWRLLKHDAVKGFIEGIARRARKYNGSLVVATQNISDFAENKSAAAAAVLSQSDWRVLLSAEGKDEKILQDQLGMNASEVEIAKNLRGDKGRFSEFMIRHSNGRWLIGRLALDPFSAKLYSSKAEDVLAIRKMQKKKKFTIEQAIEHLIKQESQ